jgi:hypothetical protein
VKNLVRLFSIIIMFDISIKMAESGCLRSESMNTMDVATKIVAESLKGNQLTHTHVSATDSVEAPALDGDYIEKNVSAALPENGDNVVISVPWPVNTYVKTVALMIVDTSAADPGATSLSATNAAAAFWIRLDADNHAATDANIMPFKRIAFENESGGDDATLFKDSPITIIKNFTGIRAEFADQVPGIEAADEVNNDAFQILDAWNANASAVKAWTNGTTNGYPLYNQSANARTNFEITFKKAEDGGSQVAGGPQAPGDAENGVNFHEVPVASTPQKLKVMAICTFLKMDLTDFGF